MLSIFSHRTSTSAQQEMEGRPHLSGELDSSLVDCDDRNEKSLACEPPEEKLMHSYSNDRIARHNSTDYLTPNGTHKTVSSSCEEGLKSVF